MAIQSRVYDRLLRAYFYLPPVRELFEAVVLNPMVGRSVVMPVPMYQPFGCAYSVRRGETIDSAAQWLVKQPCCTRNLNSRESRHCDAGSPPPVHHRDFPADLRFAP